MPKSSAKTASKFNTSFASKKAEKKVEKVEAVKIQAKPGLVMNEVHYPYGKFGLVNFTNSAQTQNADNDILRFACLPPKNLDAKTVIETQKKNMWHIYSSDWRLLYQKKPDGNSAPALNVITEITDFPHIPALRRNVECIYFHDYLVSFRDHENMWLKNYTKLFPHLGYEFDRAARNLHGVRTVIALHRDMQFKKEYADIVVDMWKWFGLKMEPNRITYFNFYVFTSSIPGNAKDKLAFLLKLPEKFRRILCLVADDISMRQLGIIVKQTNARGTFVADEVKGEDGKFIKGDNKDYLAMLNVHKQLGGSYKAPPIFINESKVSDKLLIYYSRASNVILF